MDHETGHINGEGSNSRVRSKLSDVLTEIIALPKKCPLCPECRYKFDVLMGWLRQWNFVTRKCMGNWPGQKSGCINEVTIRQGSTVLQIS